MTVGFRRSGLQPLKLQGLKALLRPTCMSGLKPRRPEMQKIRLLSGCFFKLDTTSFWGKREHGNGGVPAADFGDSLFIHDPTIPRNNGNVLQAMRRIRNDAPLHRVG